MEACSSLNTTLEQSVEKSLDESGATLIHESFRGKDELAEDEEFKSLIVLRNHAQKNIKIQKTKSKKMFKTMKQAEFWPGSALYQIHNHHYNVYSPRPQSNLKRQLLKSS